jgi:hypothetical protein
MPAIETRFTPSIKVLPVKYPERGSAHYLTGYHPEAQDTQRFIHIDSLAIFLHYLRDFSGNLAVFRYFSENDFEAIHDIEEVRATFAGQRDRITMIEVDVSETEIPYPDDEDDEAAA